MDHGSHGAIFKAILFHLFYTQKDILSNKMPFIEKYTNKSRVTFWKFSICRKNRVSYKLLNNTYVSSMYFSESLKT